jgi:hypothetical protein
MLAVVQNAGWDRNPSGVDSSQSRCPRFPRPAGAASRPALRRSSLSIRAFRFVAGVLVCAPLLLTPAAALARGTTATAGAGPKSVQQKGVPADTSVRKALIIEGDDHLFMVAAPNGWVLDDTAGMGSRIRCVFYPKGQKWATAPTVMYVNPLHGYGEKTRTLSTLIADDEKAFRHRSPHGAVLEGGTLPTAARNKLARVRYFSSDGRAPHEAVAYVPEKELVMLVVLTSKTPDGFAGALDAYHQLVASYAYVGSNREFGR